MSTHEPTMTGTKACTKCNRELPVICFPVSKHNRDGLHGECRECTRERMKKIREQQSGRQGIGERKLRALIGHKYFHCDDD